VAEASQQGRETRDLVEKLLQAHRERGFSAFQDAIAGDIRVKAPRGLGQFRDREALASHLNAVQAAFPDLQIQIDDLVVEGERVAVEVTLKGRQSQVEGREPSEEGLQVKGMAMLTVRDGKVVAHSSIIDSGALPQGFLSM